MRKLAVLIAIVALMAAPAFAEVQNVKVSGDITLRGLHRTGINLGGTATEGAEMFFMNTARVKVDADLTDNVSTCVRLVNEKDWGATTSFDVGVDLAYMTLKEFLYQPLTLTLGRQNVVFGKGFIVGNNAYSWDPEGSIGANEYSSYTAFDGIRATLDYNPWTIDAVYLLMTEASNKTEGKRDLAGVNVGYKFDEYNAEVEGYYFYGRDSQTVAALEPTEVNTLGMRGSFEPIANLTLWGEGAFQFGKTVNGTGTAHRSVRAWAADAGIEYRFSDYAWKPKLGGEIIAYSGEADPGAATGKWKGWVETPYGKYNTAIHEFFNMRTGLGYNTGDAYDPSGGTNNIQYALYGSIQPTESVGVSARYSHIRLTRGLASAFTVNGAGAANSRSKHLGDEVDVVLTYDYTEDVQFSLLGAVFFPGDYYGDASGAGADIKSDKIDEQLVGSVKVSF